MFGTCSYLAATTLQAGQARYVFPCFDEPSYKATFQLTVVYKPPYTVLSNAELESTEDRYVYYPYTHVFATPKPCDYG